MSLSGHNVFTLSTWLICHWCNLVVDASMISKKRHQFVNIDLLLGNKRCESRPWSVGWLVFALRCLPFFIRVFAVLRYARSTFSCVEFVLLCARELIRTRKTHVNAINLTGAERNLQPIQSSRASMDFEYVFPVFFFASPAPRSDCITVFILLTLSLFSSRLLFFFRCRVIE